MCALIYIYLDAGIAGMLSPDISIDSVRRRNPIPELQHQYRKRHGMAAPDMATHGRGMAKEAGTMMVMETVTPASKLSRLSTQDDVSRDTNFLLMTIFFSFVLVRNDDDYLRFAISPDPPFPVFANATVVAATASNPVTATSTINLSPIPLPTVTSSISKGIALDDLKTMAVFRD